MLANWDFDLMAGKGAFDRMEESANLSGESMVLRFRLKIRKCGFGKNSGLECDNFGQNI